MLQKLTTISLISESAFIGMLLSVPELPKQISFIPPLKVHFRRGAIISQYQELRHGIGDPFRFSCKLVM